MLTPLILSKFNRLVHYQLIGVCLGVETIIRLQDNGEVARARVNRTPRGDSLEFVNLRLYIFEVFLAEALDGLALETVSVFRPGS